jgi:hypothetical protein
MLDKLMFFGEIDSFFSLFDRFKKFFNDNEKILVEESVATRFVRLFESHGVHRNQIPRFFGHGLTIAGVKDDDALLPQLTESILDAACKLFSVRREWLDGAELQAHPCYDFYKAPDEFCEFVENLKSDNRSSHLGGVLIAPMEEYGDAQALLILEETIGYIGEKPICRFHLCNDWIFSYWKARAYLTACIAILGKYKVHIRGVYAPSCYIEQLADGTTLLGCNDGGISTSGYRRWHPVDMALKPDSFLHGVDPEKDKYGLKAGLRYWLDLENDGYMDMDLNTDAKQLFEAELEKFS